MTGRPGIIRSGGEYGSVELRFRRRSHRYVWNLQCRPGLVFGDGLRLKHVYLSLLQDQLGDDERRD